MKGFSAGIGKLKLLAFIIILASAGFSQDKIKDLQPTVIVVAIDGFRHDYLELYKPPTLNKIAAAGIRAKHLKPSFPTKTFPNHYTFATGLHPAEHGMIENNIFAYGTRFSMSNRKEVQNARWWGGEPIWVTVEKNKMISAPVYFPGSEAPVGGKHATHWKVYDHDISYQDKIANFFELIDLPKDERPQYLSIYFHDVDTMGHRHGPDSGETKDAVLLVDKAISLLKEGLQQRGIFDDVNLIFFADHGMAAVPNKNAIHYENFLNEEAAYHFIQTGEILQIFPRDGEKETFIEDSKHMKNATCWAKEDIPARFKYANNSRIAPVFCVADEGHYFINEANFAKLKGRGDLDKTVGKHGYDNDLESMQGSFFAHGKAFQMKKEIERIEMVDVYNIMCKILGIKPAPNSGNVDMVKKVLK